MNLKETLSLLSEPDRIRIIKGEEEIYTGFLGTYEIRSDIKLTGNEIVERLQAIPEIRHRQWKEKGLLPPTEPNWTAQYSFSDLEMKIYYTITLKSCGEGAEGGKNADMGKDSDRN